MDQPPTRISIIIPVKPAGSVTAISSLRQLTYPPAHYEVIVAEGTRPSRQRNRAAREASGELLCFLDDDSRVATDALARIAEALAVPGVAVVGGPSLTPRTDTQFQQAIGYVLQSSAGGGIRNRYRRVGERRVCDDRELILCNLSFRRQVFLATGGLDERLYPNEENELLERLRKEGYQLIHDPNLAVERSQRSTVRAFIRQMYGYGVGRGEQTRITGRWPVASLVPPAFLLYLGSLLLVHPWWYCLPLLVYLLLVGLLSLQAQRSRPGTRIGVWVCFIIPAMHLLYGAGQLVGLVRPRFAGASKAPGEVTLRWVKRFDQGWTATEEGHQV